MRCFERSPDDPLPLCFKATFTSVREAISAGVSPKTIPVATDAASVKQRTLRSKGRLNPGLSEPISRRLPRSLLPQAATSRPSASTRDRRTLSASSWRIRCPRDAPIAMRTACSRVLVAVRASCRFARFTHAIRRTKSIIPIMIQEIDLASPVRAVS